VPREIAVEQTPVDPLELMYREGLKKLARSMKHSDMTRNVIKRQSKFSYRGMATSAAPQALLAQRDFFLSPRCEELEETRRQLMQMIHHV
jgi:hypothetical protein